MKSEPSSPARGSPDAVTQARQAAQWERNKPSIYVDLGLGLFFFVCAKFTDLTTAALLGAAAGLSVYLVQRYVKVDLLGGLAMFGVAMLLVSAGFSWLFQDDWAVKMKGTILGLLTATLFLGDGLFNRGRYFGRRLARYVMEPVVEQRLAIGLGLLGALMASLNWGVAEFFSTDVWLAYTTFGDIALSMLLFFAVLRFARA
jgi:intracellular septation protein A